MVVIVDRNDLRRLMLAVDLATAAVIAALAMAILAHSAGLLLIYLTAFVTGTGSALRDTAAVACVPRLVSPDSLNRANARVIGRLARAAGRLPARHGQSVVGLTWLCTRKGHDGSHEDLMRRLGRGEIELTHEASNDLQPWSAASHLRDLLMAFL